MVLLDAGVRVSVWEAVRDRAEVCDLAGSCRPVAATMEQFFVELAANVSEVAVGVRGGGVRAVLALGSVVAHNGTAYAHMVELGDLGVEERALLVGSYVEFVFGRVALRKVLVEVLDSSTAAGLCEHAGFVTEGTLRDYVFRDGRFTDLHVLARFKHAEDPACG